MAVHLREHASEKMSLGSLGASLTESTFWVVLIYGFFMNLNNFGIDQTYVQRYLAAKSDESAKRSVWLGGLMYLPVSALLFLVGTALFSYYQVHAHEMSAELAGRLAEGQDGDKVFPFFIATQMPAGITGLLVAAILAAAMSSVDSSLNSSATLVLEDFVRRTGMGMSKSQKGELRVLHLATAIFGLLGIGVALAMMGVSSVLDTWWTLAEFLPAECSDCFARDAGGEGEYSRCGNCSGVRSRLDCVLEPGCQPAPQISHRRDWNVRNRDHRIRPDGRSRTRARGEPLTDRGLMEGVFPERPRT